MRGPKRKPTCELGIILDKILYEHEISSRQLSRLSGVGEVHIGLMLTGKRRPKQSTLDKLLAPLGVRLTPDRKIIRFKQYDKSLWVAPAKSPAKKT